MSASTSTISTIAGTGVAGYSGDNGPALSARLNQPSDVCPDPSGNIFIADTQNHLVRKINTSGVISRIAGTPQSPGNSGDNGSGLSAQLNQPSGFSLDQTATELYIADTRNNRIRKVHLILTKDSRLRGETGMSAGSTGMARMPNSTFPRTSL